MQIWYPIVVISEYDHPVGLQSNLELVNTRILKVTKLPKWYNFIGVYKFLKRLKTLLEVSNAT